MKTILITGCSSGIGKASAEAFRRHGWRVIATARKQADVDTLLAEGFEAWCLDIADSNQIKLVSDRIATLGGCDAFFANAGFAVPGAIEDLTRDAWRHQFETNVFGTAELVGLISSQMVKRGSGKILINSSVLGFVAMPLRGAYVASKFALEGVADTLRHELWQTGVQICLLEPGPVLAQFRKNSLSNLLKHVDVNNSRFASSYSKMVNRLAHPGAVAPFTLSAEMVAEKTVQIMRRTSLPSRLRVTLPSRINWWLKAFLPTKIMDLILRSGPA